MIEHFLVDGFKVMQPQIIVKFIVGPESKGPFGMGTTLCRRPLDQLVFGKGTGNSSRVAHDVFGDVTDHGNLSRQKEEPTKGKYDERRMVRAGHVTLWEELLLVWWW